MKKAKEKRGGAREGAGRPKKEKTKVRRIPVGLIETVEELIERYNESKKSMKAHLNQQRKDDQLENTFYSKALLKAPHIK